MHYVYQRGNSAPILQWRHGVPPAAVPCPDLGAWQPVTIVPGGPESIQGIFDGMPWWQIAGLALAAGYLARGLLR